MKISIITITYNNLVGLKETIHSIMEQGFQDFECIVVDGNSKDSTLEFLENLKDKRIRFISEPDTGIYNAQNKGWKSAIGDYCLFLNAGDRLCHKNVLQDIYLKISRFDLICFDLVLEYDKYSLRRKHPSHMDEKYMSSSSLFHPSTFISRNLLIKLNGYNEGFRIAADYDFFLRAIFDLNATVKVIHYMISVFDTKGISSSVEQAKKLQEERLKCIESLSNEKSRQILLNERKKAHLGFGLFRKRIASFLMHRFNRI